MLLRAGADVKSRNAARLTPRRERVAQRGHRVLVEILETSEGVGLGLRRSRSQIVQIHFR